MIKSERLVRLPLYYNLEQVEVDKVIEATLNFFVENPNLQEAYMHASSMENMARCFRRYVGAKQLSQENSLKVLDIGGANVNGSYRDIIEGYNLSYLAADIADGEGVDVHMADPYKIPLDDGSIDIVISGQAFEHVEFFWLLFEEIVRVVKNNGFIFLIAPSSGVIHRHPVDCYRFYPDSYYALAKYTNIHTLEVLHDERGPWRDLVGVFSKTEQSVLPLSERVFGNSNSQVFEGPRRLQHHYEYHHSSEQEHGVGVDGCDRVALGVKTKNQAGHDHCDGTDDTRQRPMNYFGEDQDIGSNENQSRYPHGLGNCRGNSFHHSFSLFQFRWGSL